MTKKTKGAEHKLKVIKKLLSSGSRCSEWQEAGLLHQIELVVTSDKDHFSSEDIQTMIEEAKNF